MKSSFIIIIFLALALWSQAQDSTYTNIKFKSWAHIYFSYGESEADDKPIGFSLNSLRFQPYGNITKNIKWGFQFGFDKLKPTLFDAYVDFGIKKFLNIKVGQFAPPAAKSGAMVDELYSSTSLVLIERCAITSNWLTNMALASYRAFGLQIGGTVAGEKLYYGLMVSNAVATDIFAPSVKQSTYSHDANGLTYWGRLEYKPFKGIGIGAFGAYGESKSVVNNLEEETIRNSYGAHIFYRKNNFAVLTEFIEGQLKIGDNDKKYNGAFADISYNIKGIEPTFRLDVFSPNDGKQDNAGVKMYINYTWGLNYYPHKDIKIQANYVFRTEQMADDLDQLKNNLLYFNLQYTFSSK